MTNALITGANKGIGFAAARRLGESGVDVLIGARDAARGEEAAELLREQVDVGDRDRHQPPPTPTWSPAGSS